MLVAWGSATSFAGAAAQAKRQARPDQAGPRAGRPFGFDRGRLIEVGQDGLDLRAEEQRSVAVQVVERFDPVAVAGEMEPAASVVPQGKGEHAVEALDAPDAPLLVSVEEDLRIRAGPEFVAEPLQPTPQLTEVVDLAVVDEPEALRRVRHRLMGGRREIDDGEPAMAQEEVPRLAGEYLLACRRVDDGQGRVVGGEGAIGERRAGSAGEAAARLHFRDEVTGIIRSAVRDDIDHRLEPMRLQGLLLDRNGADESTHQTSCVLRARHPSRGEASAAPLSPAPSGL